MQSTNKIFKKSHLDILRKLHGIIYCMNGTTICKHVNNKINFSKAEPSECRLYMITQNINNSKSYCSVSENYNTDHVDATTFEKVCEETLDSLSEYFEEIIDNDSNLNAADVSYANGVLTVNFGKPYGIYVINRQTPNKQIWLSSPTSGPKRYDYTNQGNYWLYKHDGQTLHELLQQEISLIIKNNVDFSNCMYSKIRKT